MPPREGPSSPEAGQPTKEAAVNNSTAPEPRPSTEDHDQGDDHRPHGGPHACNDGWVTIGQLVVDDETGEETEEFALYLCRRCADSR